MNSTLQSAIWIVALILAACGIYWLLSRWARAHLRRLQEREDGRTPTPLNTKMPLITYVSLRVLAPLKRGRHTWREKPRREKPADAPGLAPIRIEEVQAEIAGGRSYRWIQPEFIFIIVGIGVVVFSQVVRATGYDDPAWLMLALLVCGGGR